MLKSLQHPQVAVQLIEKLQALSGVLEVVKEATRSEHLELYFVVDAETLYC